MQKVSIRWFIKRDMPKVLKIQENFEFSWEEEDFIEALVQTNCIGMVAEANNKIVGFIIYELYKLENSKTMYSPWGIFTSFFSECPVK